MSETAASTTERNTSDMCNASSFPSESCEVLVSVSISGQQCNWYVHHSYISVSQSSAKFRCGLTFNSQLFMPSQQIQTPIFPCSRLGGGLNAIVGILPTITNGLPSYIPHTKPWMWGFSRLWMGQPDPGGSHHIRYPSYSMGRQGLHLSHKSSHLFLQGQPGLLTQAILQLHSRCH